MKVLVGYWSVLDHLQNVNLNIRSRLPKLTLITLSPTGTAGYQVGRMYGRTCQYPSGFISWVCRGEDFSSSTWGKVWKVYSSCVWWQSNPHDPKKPMVLPTTPFVKVYEWGISPPVWPLAEGWPIFNSLPKLSLTTTTTNTTVNIRPWKTHTELPSYVTQYVSSVGSAI